MGKSPSEKRKRQEVIRVRVTSDEERVIGEKARSCSMSEATLLRNLGTGFTPRSTLDQQAIALLVKTSGEQGRLGGLLKIALLKLEESSAAQTVLVEIEDLISQIRKDQTILKELVTELRG